MLEIRMAENQGPAPMLANPARKAAPPQAVPRRQERSAPEAERAAAAPAPFRARLEARRATRPQSTLGIVSGIRYPGGEAPAPAPVRAPEAAPVRACATAAETPSEDRDAAAAGALVPVGNREFPVVAMGGGDGAHGGDDDDADGAGSRIGDISQFAFAGLAVLGLAGLSVMAAETALNGGADSADAEAGSAASRLTQVDPALGPQGSGNQPAGEASAIAMAAASQPEAVETQPWFDYDALAAEITARKAAYDIEVAEAEEAARIAAEQEAAAAIAEAEAERLAEEERLAREAEETRLAEAAAEKKRLADLEAQRVADAEAARLAELEADRKAAEEAEQKRLADLEAKRLAEAEAEATRLAELEAKRAADAEARRLANLEAKRAADAEARRLAELEAKRVAEANVQTASAAAQPAQKRGPAPVVFTAHTGPVPAPASFKPEKPAVLRAAMTSGTSGMNSGEVSRNVPEAYAAAQPQVRPFEAPPVAEPVSQKVEDFIARRVQRTAAKPLDETSMDDVKAAFLTIVNTAADGTSHDIATPDGRMVTVRIERTTTREQTRSIIRTIRYTVSEYDAVQRNISTPQSTVVPMTCRDISYVIPGQERGRFAACESGKGDWMISRASEQPRTQV